MYDTLTEFQPDGTPSLDSRQRYLDKIFETGSESFEFVEKKLNGELFHLEVSGVRMKYNDEFVAVTYAKDVTQFKAMTKELVEAQAAEREMHERTQLMLDAAPIMVEYWDKDFNAIDCNKATLDFFGFSDREDIQNSILQ